MKALFDKRRMFIFVLFACLIYVSGFSSSLVASEGFTVEFIARPANITGTGDVVPKSYTGHAYIVMSARLNSGIKEEVFGFYPKAGELGIIRGPGMLTNESRCRPTEDCGKADYAMKLGNEQGAVKSVKLEITASQRREIYKMLDKWSKHEFSLNDSNCTNMLGDVLRAAGYEPPNTSGASNAAKRMPVIYVSAINDEIATQNKIRAIEKQRDNAVQETAKAKQEAAKAKKAADEAIARAKQLEQEADRIPAGWVQCNCPGQHAAKGKLVRGVLWHPLGIQCT